VHLLWRALNSLCQRAQLVSLGADVEHDSIQGAIKLSQHSLSSRLQKHAGKQEHKIKPFQPHKCAYFQGALTKAAK